MKRMPYEKPIIRFMAFRRLFGLHRSILDGDWPDHYAMAPSGLTITISCLQKPRPVGIAEVVSGVFMGLMRFWIFVS